MLCEDAAAIVWPFTSSISCTYIALLLLKTDNLGRLELPEIVLRIRFRMLLLLMFFFACILCFVAMFHSNLLKHHFTCYFLAADLPALRLKVSPTNLTPFPL